MKMIGYQIVFQHKPSHDGLKWLVCITEWRHPDKTTCIVSVGRYHSHIDFRFADFEVDSQHFTKPKQVVMRYINSKTCEIAIQYKDIFDRIPEAEQFFKVAAKVAGPVLKKEIGIGYKEIKLIMESGLETVTLPDVYHNHDLQESAKELRGLLGENHMIYDHLSGMIISYV